jgi:pimeloyl-ACP methyl ester carboxylesterase
VRPARLALLALGLVLLAGCASSPIRKPSRLPHHAASIGTADGWTVSVFRWQPAPAASATPWYGTPVVLAHGTAVNRHSFITPGSDLAAFLSARGFDVWVPEYRGDRTSTPPDARTWREAAWDVDRIAADLELLVDHIARTTGQDQVVWVGHSLGGLLGMMVAQGSRGHRVAALVALGSPGALPHTELTVSKADRFEGLLPKRGALPVRSIARNFRPVIDLGPDDPLLHALYNLDNVDARTMHRFAAEGMEDMGRGMFEQYASWVEAGRLRSADGATDYSAGLARVRVPALLIAGRVDHVAPAWTVQATWDLLGSADKEFRVLGVGWGERHDYGHMDLLLGDWTEEEVFPMVADWIQARLAGPVAPPPQVTPAPTPEPESEESPEAPRALDRSGPSWSLDGLVPEEPSGGSRSGDGGD